MKNTTARRVTKTVVRTVVGISTAFTFSNLVKNNTNPDSAIQEVEVGVATLVVGALVVKVTENYTDQVVDQIFDAFQK